MTSRPLPRQRPRQRDFGHGPALAPAATVCADRGPGQCLHGSL